MKNIFRISFFLLAAAWLAASCKKTESLPYYAKGNATQLSASTTTVAPAPADSNSVALTFSWTSPNYATDSATVKYVLQMDSTGNGFANPTSWTFKGALTASLIAKDINNILLAKGYAFGVPVSLDFRVVSSYANNNELYTSNTLAVQFTPYVVPPKVEVPASGELYIVGAATAGGWNNPVPAVTQKFSKLDDVTYQGTFYLNGDQQYLLLPVNGSWDQKYAVEDNTVAGLSSGGDFGYYSGANPTAFNSNFPAPATSGIYTITVDFQHGKFMVTPVKVYSFLWVPGDYQGWSPGTAPKLASPNGDGNYEGYVNVPSGGSYEFKLTSEATWSGTNYGDGGSGTLSTSGGNLMFPGAGYYKINASTSANTWAVTATSWSLIGDFTGWGSDADMTYDAGSQKWTATINVGSDGGLKFRANHDWGLNLGDDGANGTLEANGANISVTAGTHTVTLDLHIPGYYTYTIQ